MGWIYVLENKINHKKYVGQTINDRAERRILRHKEHAKKLDSLVIYRAIRKYGFENFKINTFKVANDLLDYFEIELIKRLNTLVPNGYNIESGGSESKNMSEATKRKISNTNKERLKDKTKHPMYGKHQTDEAKIKISESKLGKHPWNFGKKWNEEVKQKFKCKRPSITGLNHPNAKKVICETTKEIFHTVKDAAKKCGLREQRLRKYIKRKEKINGLTFRYYEDVNE